MHHWGIPRAEVQFCWQRQLKDSRKFRQCFCPCCSLSKGMCAPDRGELVGIPRKALSQLLPKVGWARHTPKWLHKFGSYVLHPCSALRSVQQDSPAWLCLWGVHINPAYASLLKKGVTLPQVGVVRKLTGLAIQSLLVFRKECLVVPLYLCMGLQSWQQNTGSGHILLWSRRRIWGATTGQAHTEGSLKDSPEGKGKVCGILSC